MMPSCNFKHVQLFYNVVIKRRVIASSFLGTLDSGRKLVNYKQNTVVYMFHKTKLN